MGVSVAVESETWYSLDRGNVSGPFSQEQLEAQRANGTFTSFAKISQDRASWISLDKHLAEVRARDNAPAPVRPPQRAGVPMTPGGVSMGTPMQREQRIRAAEMIRPFPIVALILLHFLTAGVYTFFWITSAHGVLPKMKADDPTAARAISLCFVPFYNFYWIVIVYVRLGQRINSLSNAYHLPKVIPIPLAYAMTLLIAIPIAMYTAGSVLLILQAFSGSKATEILLLFFVAPSIVILVDLLFIAPAFAILAQRGLNQIGMAQLELVLHTQQI